MVGEMEGEEERKAKGGKRKGPIIIRTSIIYTTSDTPPSLPPSNPAIAVYFLGQTFIEHQNMLEIYVNKQC